MNDADTFLSFFHLLSALAALLITLVLLAGGYIQ